MHFFEGYILIKHPPKNWGIKGARLLQKDYMQQETKNRTFKTMYLEELYPSPEIPVHQQHLQRKLKVYSPEKLNLIHSGVQGIRHRKEARVEGGDRMP